MRTWEGFVALSNICIDMVQDIIFLTKYVFTFQISTKISSRTSSSSQEKKMDSQKNKDIAKTFLTTSIFTQRLN